MQIVSSAWREKALPPAELLPYFHSRGVRYAIIDRDSKRDGAPRYFFFDRAALPDGLRPVFSWDPLQICEILPEAEAPGVAPAR